MGATLTKPDVSTPRNSLDTVKPVMAKASQSVSTLVNGDQSALTAIVREGLMQACGSLKAAAIEMGMDAGQLTRDLASGAFKFERLERLELPKQAIVITCLHEARAPMSSPEAFAQQQLDRMQDALNQVRQYVIARTV